MLGIRQISPATAVHASCVLQLSGTPHHPERQFAVLAAIGKSIVVYEVIQDNALDKEERPSQRRASDNGLPSVSLRARNHTINIGGTVSSMAELCRQCFAVWTVDRELIVIRYQGNLPGRTVFDKPWIVLYRDFMRVKPVFCYKAGVLRSIAKGEVLGLLCKRPIGFTRVRLVFPDVGDVNTLDDAWRWPSVVRHTHQDEVFGGVFSEPHRSDVSLRESVRKSTKEELWSSFSPVDVADEDLLETHSIRELCAHKHKVANHLRKWHAERHPSLPQVVVESIFQDALTVYTNGYPDPDFWRLFVCAMDEEDGSVKSLHSVSLKDEVLTHAVLDTKPPYGTLRENKMIFSYDESIIFDSVVLMDSDGKPAELWMVFHNGAVKMVPMSDTAPAAIHSQSSSEDPEDSDDDGVGSLVPRADILGLPDHFAPRRILSLESYGCGCGYTTRFALLADDIQDVYIVDLVLRRVETKLLSDGAMTSVCLGPEASLIAAHSRGVIRRLDPCLDSPITLQRRLGDPHLIRSLLSIDASHGGFRFMASTRTAYRMFEVEWGHTQTTRHSLREVHANLPEATMSQLTSLSWSIVQSNTGEPVVAECSPTCISIGTSKIQFGFTASHASITSANVEGVVRVMAAVVEEMTVHVTTDLHTSGDLSSLNSVRLECNGGGPVSAISVVTDSLATTKAYVAVAYWDASTEVFELHLQPSGWTSYSTFQAKTDNVVHHMEHLQHSSSFKSGKPVWLLSLVDHRITVLHSGAAGCASWSQRVLCNTEGIALNASLVSACRTFMSEIPQMGANFHAVLCHGRMFSLLSLEDDPSLVKAVVRCSTGYDARDSSHRWIDATMVEVVNDRIPSFAVVLSDGMDVVVTRPPPMFRLTDTVGAGGRSAPSLVLSIQTPTRYEATTHVSLPNVIDGPRDVLCLCVYAPATQRLVCVARRAERSVILSIDANTFAVEDSLHLPHYATATCAAGIPPRAESSFLSDIGGNDAIVVGTACVDRPGSIHIILPNPLREVTSVTPSSEEEDVHDISLQRLTHSSRPDDVLIGVACGKSIYVYRLVGVSLHVVCSTKCPGVCSSIALCYPTISVAMGAHGILYLEVVPRVTATSTRKRLDANVSPKVPQREEPDHDDSNVFIHGCTLRVCASEPMLMSNVLFQDSFGAKFVRCDEFGNLSLTHMLSPQSVSHDSTSAAVPVVGVRHGHQSKMTHSLQLPSQPTMSCMLGPLTNAAVSRRNPRSMMWSDKFCVLQSTNNNCGLFIPCQDGSLFAAMELPYSFAHPLLAMEQIVTDLWWHTTFSEGAHVNCQDSLRDGNSFTYRSFMTVQHAVSFESEYATAHPTHAMTKQGFVWLDAVREFYSVQRAVQRLLSGRASMKTSAKDGAGTVAFSPTTEDERIHSEEHFMAALMREKWTSLLPILRQALGEEYGPEFSLEYCEEVVHFW